ncbi:hypothetical protein M758_UG191800 [Ceratodon purpureus]|nr:hypothetical protein M758_UG191800 [Ceratodon purpureus]
MTKFHMITQISAEASVEIATAIPPISFTVKITHIPFRPPGVPVHHAHATCHNFPVRYVSISNSIVVRQRSKEQLRHRLTHFKPSTFRTATSPKVQQQVPPADKKLPCLFSSSQPSPRPTPTSTSVSSFDVTASNASCVSSSTVTPYSPSKTSDTKNQPVTDSTIVRFVPSLSKKVYAKFELIPPYRLRDSKD